ncbi:MAG: hypothetical protein DMF37_05410 [Verrucomicrobia bacterium]|nr:MAG: hypothetical protein DMF37_05410 [Verrucomicrobiota bacterium]
MCSAISGPAPSVGLEFFRAQGRADLGQIIGEGWVLLCTGARTMIFDNLVSDFKQHTRRGNPK